MSGNEEDFKVKIFFEKQASIIYYPNSFTLEDFTSKIKEACCLQHQQGVTLKWVDSEGSFIFLLISSVVSLCYR
jgi:hypothetical protein